MNKIKSTMALLLLLILILGSCSSAPDQIEKDLPEELFFKTAQNAMDNDQYRVALYYYEVYTVRYPENHKKVIAAEYERAFIYYKMKDLKYAQSLFNQVIDKYENSPFKTQYPVRYKILSSKILDIIDEQLNGKKDTDNPESSESSIS